MRSTRMTLCLLAILLGAAAFAPAAAAQDSPRSVSDLRRENDQLRLRIDELEAQLSRSQEALEQLLKQVEQLNERVAQLQRELEGRPAGQSPGPAAEPQIPTPVFASLPEGQPFAAPEAMLALSRESYEETFGDVRTPFESAEARSQYLRDAESWIKSLKRSQRSQVEWIIEVRNFVGDGEPLTIEYRAVDPKTRLAYSDRVFTLQIPSRFERRFREARETRYWQLRGVAGLSLNLNRERESIGFFDVRPFIGPFVEFAMDLSVGSLLPAPEQEDADAGDTQPPQADSEGS